MVFGVYVVLHHHCMALLSFTAVQLEYSQGAALLHLV